MVRGKLRRWVSRWRRENFAKDRLDARDLSARWGAWGRVGNRFVGGPVWMGSVATGVIGGRIRRMVNPGLMWSGRAAWTMFWVDGFERPVFGAVAGELGIVRSCGALTPAIDEPSSGVRAASRIGRGQGVVDRAVVAGFNWRSFGETFADQSRRISQAFWTPAVLLATHSSIRLTSDAVKTGRHSSDVGEPVSR